MKIRRYVNTASIMCSLAFGFTGSAFASISIDTTGAGSTQKVIMNDTTNKTIVNRSLVEVLHANVQSAHSGDVSANKNTSVAGNVGSGDVANSNTATTKVVVTNEVVPVLPVGGSGNGGSTTGVVGGSGSSNPGRVLGAASVGGFGAGAAMLPSVGASVPVDVSALRAAWHPQTNVPTAALVERASLFTGFMLLTATLLSIMGAVGSAWYSKRQERI